MKCELVPIEWLKLHEKVLPRYLETIIELLKKDSLVKYPIIVDQTTGTVLDGSHRTVALLSLGCLNAPVIKVNYYDPSISVGSRRKHRFRVDKPISMSKGAILWASLTGNLMPPRSSRHFFKFNKLIRVDVPLKDLFLPSWTTRPSDCSNSSFRARLEERLWVTYIADYTLEQEIKDLSLYIEECDEDIFIISDLENEVIEIRDDLMRRLEELKKQND